MILKRRSQKHARNNRDEILSLLMVASYPNGHLKAKTMCFYKFVCISLENMGLWVKSGWYRRSGLVVRSSAHNPSSRFDSPLPPSYGILVGSLSDPTTVLVGGAPSGGIFHQKVRPEIGNSVFPWFEIKISKFDDYCRSGPLYWIQQQRAYKGL